MVNFWVHKAYKYIIFGPEEINAPWFCNTSLRFRKWRKSVLIIVRLELDCFFHIIFLPHTNTLTVTSSFLFKLFIQTKLKFNTYPIGFLKGYGIVPVSETKMFVFVPSALPFFRPRNVLNLISVNDKNSSLSLKLVSSIFTDVLQKYEKHLKVYVNEDVGDQETDQMSDLNPLKCLILIDNCKVPRWNQLNPGFV